MRLVVMRGVFAPISDTRMLAQSLRRHVTPQSAVLDLCTGSGAVAIAAALAGARSVAAGDIDHLSVFNARCNAWLNHVAVEVKRGDLLAPFAGRRFDLISANPPYVPSESSQLPVRGPARAWDAGLDGRLLIERICAEAPAHLRPGGALLMTHSSWCNHEATLDSMRAAGLQPEVALRARGPLGPLLSARAASIQSRGHVAPGTCEEELLVIRGSSRVAQRPSHPVKVPAQG